MISKSRRFLGALFLTAALWACDDGTPSGAADTGATTDTGGRDLPAGTDPGGTTDSGATTDPGGGQVSSIEVGGDRGGGSLEAPNGEATLVIPGGALDNPTTVTCAVLGPTSDTASVIYDFGPDGLAFQTPATLTIQYKGPVPPPGGKKAVLAWYDEKASQWVDIAGSTLQVGSGVNLVTGQVEHFTRFAIVLRDDQVVVEGCVEDIDAFQACGGDPTGRWKFQDACLQMPLGGGGGECPGMTQGGDIEYVNLVMDFQGGQVTASMDKVLVTIDLTVPKSCMPGVPCSALEQDGKLSCTDAGSNCSCTGSQEEVPEDSPSTKAYTISGGSITIGNDTSKFCVQGDELRLLQEDPEDGSRQLLILKRQ